jgi:hypothetical protein
MDSAASFAINVVQALIEAGLKTSPDSDDVVLASSDQAVLLHVRDHASGASSSLSSGCRPRVDQRDFHHEPGQPMAEDHPHLLIHRDG